MTVPIFLALFHIVLIVWMFLEVTHGWSKLGSFITMLLLAFYAIVFVTKGDKPSSPPPGVGSIQSQQDDKVCETN